MNVDLSNIVPTLHWFGCLVILMEAMNKLERTDPWQSGLTGKQRLVMWVKAIAWVILGLASFCALIRPIAAALMGTRVVSAGPFLLLNRPSAMDVAQVWGFALLIVRSRLKEVPHGTDPAESTFLPR